MTLPTTTTTTSRTFQDRGTRNGQQSSTKSRQRRRAAACKPYNTKQNKKADHSRCTLSILPSREVTGHWSLLSIDLGQSVGRPVSSWDFVRN